MNHKDKILVISVWLFLLIFNHLALVDSIIQAKNLLMIFFFSLTTCFSWGIIALAINDYYGD